MRFKATLLFLVLVACNKGPFREHEKTIVLEAPVTKKVAAVVPTVTPTPVLSPAATSTPERSLEPELETVPTTEEAK